MSELVEFIRGCLDADEQTARAATPGPWVAAPYMPQHADESFRRWYDAETDRAPVYELTGPKVNEDGDEWPTWNAADATHIARHDPARVLAEVNAKRAVVDMLADAEAVIARIGPGLDKPGDAAEWANYHAWRQAVEALAQPFRGEPGWRDEWGTQ